MSKLLIKAFPFVGGRSVASIESVVDFPAPFGPKSQKISPSFTIKLMPSTAVKSSNFFVKFSTLIDESIFYIAKKIALKSLLNMKK